MRSVPKTENEKIVESFFVKEIAEQEAVIDKVPVFGKRYCNAVDRLDDLEAVKEAFAVVLRT